MINVTKTFLPPFEEYAAVLKRAWDSGWITNNGELVLELEEKLKQYLAVEHLLLCSNGTVVLQMALKVFNITKEVITTPLSYVATTNTIIWENCTPVFVDVEPYTLCIDSNKIEDSINENTQAILATHVYGFPCNIEKIEAIAKKYNLKVIYDGAHAFACNYKSKSLLAYGDITTCSFHATKLFHTAEGGAIICRDKEIYDKLYLYRQFGHIYDDYLSVGINAKNSELHAAMGLCVFKYVDQILRSRKEQWLAYHALLKDHFQLLDISNNTEYNYSYFPVIFGSEKLLLQAIAELKKVGVLPRRYFYPSLNMLKYLAHKACPVSESIAQRVLCLPLFTDLSYDDQILITDTLVNIIRQ